MINASLPSPVTKEEDDPQWRVLSVSHVPESQDLLFTDITHHDMLHDPSELMYTRFDATKLTLTRKLRKSHLRIRFRASKSCISHGTFRSTPVSAVLSPVREPL